MPAPRMFYEPQAALTRKPYAHTRELTQRLRTGTIRIYDGKPNRNPVTMPFVAPVYMSHQGTARENLSDAGRIATPTRPDTLTHDYWLTIMERETNANRHAHKVAYAEWRKREDARLYGRKSTFARDNRADGADKVG